MFVFLHPYEKKTSFNFLQFFKRTYFGHLHVFTFKCFTAVGNAYRYKITLFPCFPPLHPLDLWNYSHVNNFSLDSHKHFLASFQSFCLGYCFSVSGFMKYLYNIHIVALFLNNFIRC